MWWLLLIGLQLVELVKQGWKFSSPLSNFILLSVEVLLFLFDVSLLVPLKIDLLSMFPILYQPLTVKSPIFIYKIYHVINKIDQGKVTIRELYIFCSGNWTERSILPQTQEIC